MTVKFTIMKSKPYLRKTVNAEERCQDSAKKCGETAETGPFTFSLTGSSLCYLSTLLFIHFESRSLPPNNSSSPSHLTNQPCNCLTLATQAKLSSSGQQKAPFTMLYASNLIRWLQRKRYQYEVTFSLYMLTPMEKFIFSMFPSSVIEIPNFRACQVLSLF